MQCLLHPTISKNCSWKRKTCLEGDAFFDFCWKTVQLCQDSSSGDHEYPQQAPFSSWSKVLGKDTFWPEGDAVQKVRGSLKSLVIILWGPWIALQADQTSQDMLDRPLFVLASKSVCTNIYVKLNYKIQRAKKTLFGVQQCSVQQICGSGFHHSTYKSPSAPDVGLCVVRDHLRMVSSGFCLSPATNQTPATAEVIQFSKWLTFWTWLCILIQCFFSPSSERSLEIGCEPRCCLSFYMSHELYQHFEPDW